MSTVKEIKRCPWCQGDELYEAYHDQEWGVPCHDDLLLFEHLALESFQAGLSWRTILYKRENFRKAFKDFHPPTVAKFKEKDIKRLLLDAGIIRNRMKIEAVINNASRFMDIQEEHGRFSKYIWQFAPKRSAKRRTLKSLPAKTKESDAMAADLKRRGFKFLGTTTCYAFMQAVGMVNDHLVSCYKFKA